jgi:hypothetical protein
MRIPSEGVSDGGLTSGGAEWSIAAARFSKEIARI